MARKISEHPDVAPGTVLDGTEVALFNKDGTTYKGTMAELLPYKADLDSPEFTGPVSFAGPVDFNADVAFLGAVSGLDKSDVGLNLVDNTPDLSKPISAPVQSALSGKLDTASLGAASGVASLGADGKLTPSQMPAGIDAVQEYANVAAFPATGASNIIYLAADTSKSYRWGTTVYVEIVASPGTTDSVTEGTTNLYHTAARVRSAVLTGLSTATNAVISATDTVLSMAGKLQAQISAHFGAGGTAHAAATTSTAGFLSAADKLKLDGLSPGGGNATNLNGGTTGALAYQSAVGVTAFTTNQLRVVNSTTMSFGTSANTLTIQGAAGASDTSAGSSLTVQGGSGNATSGAGGGVTIRGGNAVGSGFSAGPLVLQSGTVATGQSASDTQLRGGDSTGTSAAGDVVVRGGNNSSSGAGGNTLLSGGTSTSGAGGYISLRTGATLAERVRVRADGAISFGSSGTAVGTAGQVLMSNGAGAVPTWQDAPGGSGSPGGVDTQVQFNDGGAFGGDSAMTWNKTTNTLTVTNIVGALTGNATNVTGTVAIANGGTGQTTAVAALNALLPTQTGQGTKVLGTDGTNATWVTAGGGGVGGSDTQLQYNNAGVVAGASGLTWSEGSRILSVGTTSAGFIQNQAAATGGTPALTIRTVAPTTSGNTGVLNLTAGNAVTGGSAGSINLTAGAGIGSVVAGSINLTAGGTAGTGTCGPVSIEAGTSTNASTAGGNITIDGGRNSTAAGTGGSVSVAGGPVNTSGTAGNLTVRGGNAGAGGTGGNALIWGGSGGTSGGKIVFRTFPTTSGVDRLQILANGAWSVGDGATFTGTAGQVLTSNGNGSAPTWQAASQPLSAAVAGSAINVTLAEHFTKTIVANTTFTVSSVPAAGNFVSFILDLTNGGAFTVSWWSGMQWVGGLAPSLTVAGRDSLSFYTIDGGTTWTGLVLGLDIK